MIVERSTHPQFVSNTFLVADGEGGPAFFVDAGGPVEPLIEAAERLGARADATSCSPTTTTTTSARSSELRERWPDLKVLISAREGELLERRRRESATGDGPIEAGETLRFGALDGARAAHARAHRRDALVPRRAERRRGSPRSGRSFTGDTLFKDSVGGVKAPGHTTYADLRDSIMGTLMELAPETVIHPGHADDTTVGRGVGGKHASSASGAASTPRAPSPAPRSASPPRWCCSARTTTAARRPGCAGPTAPTTSCRARKSSAARAEPPSGPPARGP